MFCAVFQQGCSALAVQVAAHDTASALYLKWEIFYAYTPPVLKDWLRYRDNLWAVFYLMEWSEARFCNSDTTLQAASVLLRGLEGSGKEEVSSVTRTDLFCP